MFSHRVLVTVLIILICSDLSVAQKLESPTLTPTPLTEQQRTLVREGGTLHDQGQFQEALAKYEAAYRENQNNDIILYEMAYSYYALKDFKKCFEFGYRAANFDTKNLAKVYVLLGNALDQNGEPQRALDVYKFGLKRFPKEGALYFNQAITLRAQGKIEEAKASAKKSASANPAHASTQLLLANLFLQGGFKLPALFAASRFLILEPSSSRSLAALQIVNQVMQGGVQRKDAKNINILVDMNAKTDEGDFSSIELFLGILKAGSMTEENKGKTETQLLAGQLETLFAMLSGDEVKGGKSKFAAQYYVPYFVEMNKRKLVETFCYMINASSGKSEVKEWLTKNQNRIDEFVNWSNSYKWPIE